MENEFTELDLFTIAGECVAVRIRMINRVITAIYDERFRPVGIKASQMNILVALAVFGPHKQADICRVLKIDPSTLSRNVDRMKRNGWLEKTDGPDDEPGLVAVTPRGRKKIAEAFPAWNDAQEEVRSALGDEAIDGIMRLGDKLLGFDPGSP